MTQPRGSTGTAVAVFLAIASFSNGNFVFGQQPDAASTTNGATMLSACRDLERMRDAAGASSFRQGYCLGAVLAAVQLHNNLEFCISQPTPKLQLVRIVVDYVEKNPTKQDRELAVLASWALTEAYPCAPNRRR